MKEWGTLRLTLIITIASRCSLRIEDHQCLRSCYKANTAQKVRARDMYDANGSQVPYFNSKPLFEVAIIIILLSWQFSPHDDKKETREGTIQAPRV